MSKMDGLRAMREARYAAAAKQAGQAKQTRRAKPATEPAATKVPQTDVPVAPPTPVGADGLCGHRSMNGRTCTREHGHAAKSHRYG